MSIELKQVSYTYASDPSQPVNALKNVSLAVRDGEFVGIMGHTGCGKTTLLQLIAGLISPTSGQVLLNGSDINSRGYDRSILRRSIGLIFQYPEYQLFETTVEKDVAFGLKHSGLGKTEIRKRVQEALELMGFSYESIRLESPLALSGGEKRRVAIAGVLAAKPDILCFDEPVAGLDPASRKNFLDLIAGLNQGGTTVLMISHNTDCLCEYAGRIIVLDEGCLVMDGTPKSVFSDAGRTKQLNIGSSQARIISDMLMSKGFSLPKDILRYDELLDGLKAVLKNGDGPKARLEDIGVSKAFLRGGDAS